MMLYRKTTIKISMNAGKFLTKIVNNRVQKMASYLHRTATTEYPCCVPALGDSTGAGRVGLATAKIQPFLSLANPFCVLIFSIPSLSN